MRSRLVLLLLVCAALPARAERTAAQRTSSMKAARPSRLGWFRRGPLRQHPFAPMRKGQERVVKILDPKGAQVGTLVERVTGVERTDGRLHGQIESTWKSDISTSVTHSVGEVSSEGLHPTTRSKLGEAPVAPGEVNGIALPRRLAVGKSWTSTQTHSVGDAVIATGTTSRVIAKVRRADPEGKMRTGFVVDSVISSATSFGREIKYSTTNLRTVLLKGIGEVETEWQTPGESGKRMRKLEGFTPGRD